MTRGEAINWIINLTADIGKVEHRDLWHYEQALEEIRDMIEAMPLVQPERIRGRWKPFDLTWGRSIYACSVCGQGVDVPTEMGTPIYRYCPHCGADMREDQ